MVLKGVGRSKMRSLGISDSRFRVPCTFLLSPNSEEGPLHARFWASGLRGHEGTVLLSKCSRKEPAAG